MGHGQRAHGPVNRGMWGSLWLTMLALVCLAGPATAHASAAQWEGVAVKVVDGDTLHVQAAQGGASHKLRIKGIDAPELCQSWGGQSREALARLVWGQRLTVLMRDVDDHGRWLVHVMVQGKDVGALMVAQGHAWSYQFRRDPGPYAALEQQAAGQRLGLFSQPPAIRPREFRQRHGPCR
jgi:micrococcal nuclease